MEEVSKRNKTILIVMFLAAMLILVYGSTPFKPLTIISPPQNVYIEIQDGEEVAGEWTGSYWSMLVAVTSSDEMAGFKALQKNQSYTIEIEGEKYDLRSGADIEVRIDPEQPYFTRKIQSASMEIVPTTFRTWANRLFNIPYKDTAVKANSSWSGHLDWAEPGWRWYTPYTITILKNGEVIATKTLNTEGVDKVQIVETSEGNIRIEHLGALSGEYRTIEVPEQIVIFDKSYVYDWADRVDELLKYDVGAMHDPAPYEQRKITPGTTEAYSRYWYGYYRWIDDMTPSGYPLSGFERNNSPGWVWKDDSASYVSDPVAPVISPEDKGELPSEKRAFML